MSCARCNETRVNDRFYDRVDEQEQLHLGAWRWTSRCPVCGNMVDERDGNMAADTSANIDRTNPMPVFQMF